MEINKHYIFDWVGSEGK